MYIVGPSFGSLHGGVFRVTLVDRKLPQGPAFGARFRPIEFCGFFCANAGDGGGEAQPSSKASSSFCQSTVGHASPDVRTPGAYVH